MTKRIVVRLPRSTKRRLTRQARKCHDADLRIRILIVLKFEEGLGSQTIAAMLQIVPATAVRVAHRFLERGEAGLIDGRSENGTPKIDDDLLQALAELVSKQPKTYGLHRSTWTREAMTRVLHQVTGVKVSPTTVARMLKQLGARWGRPRPVVMCPWSKRRKGRRVAALRRVLNSLKPGNVAYFEDEVDIHLNPRIGSDWMLRGQQKLVVTPGKNAKRYVAGALASDGSDFVFVSSARKNSDLFLALLERLLAKHSETTVIHLVLDNFIIHDSRRVRAFVASLAGRIQLHFLPPYSPEHNKIERRWRELHANVTRNHQCRNIAQLMFEVRRYLGSYAAKLRAQARAPKAA